MKTKKMSLANIEGKLSRSEMKNIMAGTGSNCGPCGTPCSARGPSCHCYLATGTYTDEYKCGG